MTVARSLGQAVLLLALLGCLARLLAVAIGNQGRVQDDAATADDRPIWMRDQHGGGVCPAAMSAATARPRSRSASVSTTATILGCWSPSSICRRDERTRPRSRSNAARVHGLHRPYRPGDTEVWSAYR